MQCKNNVNRGVFWKMQDAVFATENAGLTGTTERKVLRGNQ